MKLKYINIKIFSTSVLLNLIPLILGAISCSGESCMIIIIAFAYWILWLICYIPYLLIGSKIIKSKSDKIVLFLLPSVIAILLLFISKFELIENHKSVIYILIIPNTILQIILYFCYQSLSNLKLSELNDSNLESR